MLLDMRRGVVASSQRGAKQPRSGFNRVDRPKLGGGQHRRLTSFRGFAIVMVAAALSGCFGLPGSDPDLGSGVGVRNETEFTLHFRVWSGDKSYALASEVRPRQTDLLLGGPEIGPNSLVTTDGCTTGDLVAFDPDGNEIARHSAPLCVDDLWVIETSASSSAP